MLVGNHSGGVALDGAMVLASMFFEMEPPRLAQGMVEKFINMRAVRLAVDASRTGQFTGLPEHAERLLEDERLLMVFPEGARGTAKLYWERHSLVRLRHRLRAPGAADQARRSCPSPSSAAARPSRRCSTPYKLGKLFGAPYMPVTP